MIIKSYEEVKYKKQIIIVCNDFDTEEDAFLLGIPKGLSGEENMKFYPKQDIYYMFKK